MIMKLNMIGKDTSLKINRIEIMKKVRLKSSFFNTKNRVVANQ